MQKLTLWGSKTGALPYKRVRPRFILSVDEPFWPRPFLDAGHDPHRGEERHDG